MARTASAIEGCFESSANDEPMIHPDLNKQGDLTMRLSDAGLRRHPTKLIYLNHRPLLGSPKLRPVIARTDC